MITSAGMFTLAHLSDPHVGPLPRPSWRQLASKRALGYLSWTRRRRRLHRTDVLEALVRDLEQQRPDHVAVTGDLVNISLPAEFPQAAAWLQRLGPADRVSVVPGNHDAYVRVPWDQSLGHWADNMTSDATGQAAEAQGLRFPYLRRRGPIALIGLSTALPTPPLLATGTLGDAQLNMLDRLLHRLGEERCFRVVLLHHPPLAPAAHWRKNLTDAPALRDVIAEHGAELVLHGHNHRLELAELDSRVGPVPVVGVPSASAVQSGKHPESHYQICGIVPADAGWRLSFRLRRFDPLGSAFTEGPARQVTLPRRYAN